MMINFKSIFSKELNDYIKYKQDLCLGNLSIANLLSHFDLFCVALQLSEKKFGKNLSDKYCQKRPLEHNTTHYNRVNTAKNFLAYLHLKGYEVYVPDNVRYIPSDFQPYIYTKNEIIKYFAAADTLTKVRPLARVQIPILFRLLYSTGIRIGEVLSIKKKNINFAQKYISIDSAKWGSVRNIYLEDRMLYLIKKFAFKTFYLLNSEDYIFHTRNGDALRESLVYEWHRKLLYSAGIPYRGSRNGPRIHDWRHTFAVNSFHKLIVEEQMDLYTALPIISAYLGHRTILATEKYVRLTREYFPEITNMLDKPFFEIFGDTL